MKLIDYLYRIEQAVFKFINADAARSWLDMPMMITRDAKTWIPLYLCFIIFFWVKLKKQAPLIILLSLVTFAITDFTSAQLLKPWIGRIRPCYETDLSFIVNNIIGCGGKYAFPSSHASNHFGLATLWFFTIHKFFGQKWWWLFIWAVAICYAQVYVGVHYPGDVLGGSVLGILVGLLIYKLLCAALTFKPANLVGN